ncbi:2-dehydropantoate 2-reductase [Niallia sp. Krafla_26]|uniref:2-dehydropantoate 2-reductase n=1 Tax=Niallia sp. Krafla_26 TaxID=3064703 RepID=UPI003D180121
MKIGVIGGGAIGLLFSYYLSEIHSVCLYVHSEEQLEIIKEKGILLEKEGQMKSKSIPVKIFSEWHGEEDVTLIALKQYHLPGMISRFSSYSSKKHAFLFLQNGMGHLKYFDKMDGEIYIGTVEHGAMKLDGNHVIHTGLGVTKIAAFRETTVKFHHFIKKIQDESFPFVVEDDYEQMLIQKLVVNAIINPLTAILQIKNGELIHNPYYFELVKRMFTEIRESLNLQNDDKYFKHIMAVCEQTAQNDSSMLRDLKENRPTEIDAILGYILERAAEKEISTPVLEVFYQAVKGKECRVEDNTTCQKLYLQ